MKWKEAKKIRNECMKHWGCQCCRLNNIFGSARAKLGDCMHYIEIVKNKYPADWKKKDFKE